MLVLTRRRWPKVRHESLQVYELDSIGDLWLAKDSHEAVDLNTIKLRYSDLVATSQEIVGCHNFNVFLTIEVRQIVDDVVSTERLPNCEVVHDEALCDAIEDSFCNV